MTDEPEILGITSDDVASLTEIVTELVPEIDDSAAAGPMVIEREGAFDFQCQCGFASVRHETEESAQARGAEHLAEHLEGGDALADSA